jgi:hypothetical protein
MFRLSWNRRLTVAALTVALLAGGASITLSQSKKPKEKEKKPPNVTEVRNLETQAEKAKDDYVKGLAVVAQGFEEQGLTDKLKSTLYDLLQVAPENEAARMKLKEIEEAVYEENSLVVEVDATKGWTMSVAVAKDKPLRLQAEGTLRVLVNETVDPDGLVSDDPLIHQIVGIPTGALMGVVRDPRNAPRDEKISPFTVGHELELSPKSDGILFLKLNLPANSQSKGKIRVTISGNFQKMSGPAGS